MCSALRIDGSATPTIDTSRPSSSSAPLRTMRIPHSWGVQVVSVEVASGFRWPEDEAMVQILCMYVQ